MHSELLQCQRVTIVFSNIIGTRRFLRFSRTYNSCTLRLFLAYRKTTVISLKHLFEKFAHTLVLLFDFDIILTGLVMQAIEDLVMIL